MTMGSTPATGRRLPDSDSSPMKTVPTRDDAGTAPQAARTPTAIARSKWVPLLGRSAGASRIVTRNVAGHVSLGVGAELLIAIRTRSRASCSEASGRPTTDVPTVPCETATCTSMRCPSAPTSAIEQAVATRISTAPARGRSRRGRGAG